MYPLPAIVQNYTYHNVSQQNILANFANHDEQGRKHYERGNTSFWESCVDALDGYNQKESWPTWADDLAKKIHRSDDVVRQRANAELMYRLGCMFDKDVADALRGVKEYNYFRAAWKYRHPKRGETQAERVSALLYHVGLSDSVVKLEAELKALYNPLSPREQLQVEMRILASNLIAISGDDMIGKSTRRFMRFTANKLKNW